MLTATMTLIALSFGVENRYLQIRWKTFAWELVTKSGSMPDDLKAEFTHLADRY